MLLCRLLPVISITSRKFKIVPDSNEFHKLPFCDKKILPLSPTVNNFVAINFDAFL